MNSWADYGWTLTVDGTEVSVESVGLPSQTFTGAQLGQLTLSRRWWRWSLAFRGAAVLRMPGLDRRRASAIRDALAGAVAAETEAERQRERTQAEAERRARLERLRLQHASDLFALVVWDESVQRLWDRATQERVWVPRDTVTAAIKARPPVDELRRLRRDRHVLSLLSPAERAALDRMDEDLLQRRDHVNRTVEARELVHERRFFDTIEKSPLTEEQAKAVLCVDNRVQVIAAAGSGKTSVMVARAAYAIKRGIVPADRILLLAFNANAADELEERIEARLSTQGIDTTGLRAATFHSFGLTLLGQASGTKPRLAPWLESGKDVEMVGRIVDELRDSSHSFRYKWDLYRLLFARAASTPEGAAPEWWDRDTGVSGHRTLNGETVRSQGEKMIADWLFLNGVAYEYERAYDHPVADESHAQYRPDFYYPDVDVWHEHWALGRDGKPPADFVGYADGMTWKRSIHRRHGTSLIETTWADIIDRSGFEPFAADLEQHGLELDWNPDRPLPQGAQPVKHEELAKLMRSFMSHVKANSFTRSDLDRRVAAAKGPFSGYRTRLFLDLYWDIHDAWEERLAAEGCVDFEDMLIKAAEALESGAVNAGYDMVLVDEFQDSSAARARMVRALARGDDKYLLTVGDDWQSIYRFAGADVSVMTDFEQWFGPTETRRLQTTFRSTQAITDVASAFVSANPRQIAKTVTSAQGPGGAPVTLATINAANPNRPDVELAGAVESYLRHLARRLETGDIVPGRDGSISVDILGRYRFEEGLLPQRVPDGLKVTFRTIHRAKGLEADYVLIPRAVDGMLGFPSRVESDPVLDLVMAAPDAFPFGEERRLFYVALTRARREAAIITVSGKESPFVVELLKAGLLQRVGSAPFPPGGAPSAPASSAAVCPTCGEGLLVPRKGKHGAFWGCARFPACRHTQNESPANGATGRRS